MLVALSCKGKSASTSSPSACRRQRRARHVWGARGGKTARGNAMECSAARYRGVVRGRHAHGLAEVGGAGLLARAHGARVHHRDGGGRRAQRHAGAPRVLQHLRAQPARVDKRNVPRPRHGTSAPAAGRMRRRFIPARPPVVRRAALPSLFPARTLVRCRFGHAPPGPRGAEAAAPCAERGGRRCRRGSRGRRGAGTGGSPWGGA
eukprot:scaffold2220_cov377-Prasinococcus_capsulatus_cf.AAC.14